MLLVEKFNRGVNSRTREGPTLTSNGSHSFYDCKSFLSSGDRIQVVA